MMNLCCDVLEKLRGKTLVTAESCTGGGIGAALTAIPGSSDVYKGGVICYTNFVKEHVLGVDRDTLEQIGAVSEAVAGQMAHGVRQLLKADISLSVTGLAGPGGDDFGNCVGTVYIGCETADGLTVRHFVFEGDRASVRCQAVEASLRLIMECT